jgi:fluoroquinolone transport system ATP-binding protein
MIEVENLTFSYQGSAQLALNGLSFAVQPGEIFGFLGPSGAGKSTTQKILIGLLKGYQGQVRVLGRDLRSWGKDYYERVGVCFEIPAHHLKLTALENLAYFRAFYAGPTEEPAELLRLVGLEQDGDKPAAQFSKGMRIRLNLAQALLHRPELLFLDEPTAGLDPVNARRIRTLIRQKQQQGTTIFLTTHDMAVAEELCDRVAFIVDGRLNLIDAPRRLKLDYGRPTVRVEYEGNGRLAGVEYPLAGLWGNQEFLALLREQKVQTIHSQETTLEDIFIGVTGRRLQ